MTKNAYNKVEWEIDPLNPKIIIVLKWRNNMSEETLLSLEQLKEFEKESKKLLPTWRKNLLTTYQWLSNVVNFLTFPLIWVADQLGQTSDWKMYEARLDSKKESFK